jgi:hypothetical protein
LVARARDGCDDSRSAIDDIQDAKARAEYEARFAGLCEAIEFITYNGNSFRERQEAFDRARAQVK